MAIIITQKSLLPVRRDKQIYSGGSTSSKGVSVSGGGSGSMTAGEILTALLGVDGAGSGLDADLFDGVESALYAKLADPTFTGTVSATTIHTTTILADHIGEHTEAHHTIFDSLMVSNIGIVPDANDGAYLGTTSLGWSDLFLASGAVLNYANSNVTLTHSSGILTLNVGTLKITTPTNTATSVVTIDGTQTLTNKTLTSPNINEAVALTSTSTKLNYLTGATGTTGTATTNIVFSASPTFTGVTTVNEITSNTHIRLAVTGADEYYFGATVDEFVLKNNTDGTYPLRISSDATTNNVVLKGANVGIGTATPSSKLSINGGLHVGGDSDAGDNNALIDGTLGVTGISTFTGLIKTVGGIHVGGTSDPGIDNILVDGTISAGATTVSAKIHSLATTEQLRLGYDDAKYTSFTTDTNGDLTIAATGNDILIPHTDTICSADWVSRTTGWGIYHMADGRSGGADFRYLSVDEMHAKRFVADLEQALAGAQVISKSVAILHADVVIPAKGASVQIEVEDLPGSIANVFANNDWVQLRLFNRDDDGSFIIANAWGRVTFIDHHAATGDEPGYQHYTFSRSAIDAGTASGETVLKGAIILDFGVTGDGFIETTTIDAAGSPYQQVVTWETDPWTQTVRTRTGQLDGIAGIGDEWGFFAGNTTAQQYFLASDQHFELHGIDLLLYDGAINTVKLDHTGLSFAMGTILPSGFLVQDGIWMGKDTTYKMRVGTVSGGALVKGFKWDGADLTIIGGITATTGAIGGWVIGTTTLMDAAGVVGMSSTVTVGDDVRFWAGHVTPSSAPFRVTEAGVLTASSGTIGGFTITASELYAGTGATRVEMQAAGGFWAGATAQASAPFRVTSAGVLTASSGTVGGFTLSTTTLIAGFGATRISLSTTAGIHLGHDTFASAPFSVTLAGVLKATSGTVAGWNIGTDKLYCGTSDMFYLKSNGNICHDGQSFYVYSVQGNLEVHTLSRVYTLDNGGTNTTLTLPETSELENAPIGQITTIINSLTYNLGIPDWTKPIFTINGNGNNIIWAGGVETSIDLMPGETVTLIWDGRHSEWYATGIGFSSL
jgi:hypothetical protein